MSKQAGKNANKQIRQPLGEESTVNSLSQADKIRMVQGKQAKLDASFYERLAEYQGKQLFWENHIDGQVETWLHLGAELVPRKNKSLKEFKGFTDQASSEWECVPGGGDGNGGQMLVYLMSIDAEEYQKLKIDPKNQRNAEILDALGMGKSQADGQVMSNVKGLKTYAPNLPTGGTGFEQTHDV